MKKRLTLTALLMMVMTAAWADTLDVCLPWNHVQNVVPINANYADWGFENEFIYPASRVGEMAGGAITQITFYAVRDSLDFTETFMLRMEEVADSATQPLSWVHTDAMRLVWTGSAAIRDSLWTITLDTAFPYMGGNLLLSFLCTGQDGGFYTNENIFCSYATDYYSINCRNANAQHVINSWFYAPQRLPSATFVYTPNAVGDCHRPLEITVDSVGPNVAYLSWDTVSGALGYEWELYAEGLLADSGFTTNNTLVFNTLSQATDYIFRMRTVCDSDSRSVTVQRTFTTLCDVITPFDLPFVEDFEDYPTMSNFHGIRCWTLLAYSREYMLRVESNTDGNKVFSFCPQNNSTPQFAVLPEMQGIRGMHLTFRMRNSYCIANMQVGVMTDPTDTLTFTPVAAFDTVMTANVWQNMEVIFPYYASNTGHIAFRAGMAPTVTGCWIEIDDIAINSIPTCNPAQGIEVTHITATSADIVVHDNDTTGVTYAVTLTGGGTTRTATFTGTTLTLTALNPTTDYTVSVRKHCADNTGHLPLTATFHTACAPMQLPWSESFENIGTTIPECWKTINGQSNPYSIATAVGYGSGMRSLTGYSLHAPELLVVLPEFDMQPDSLLLGLEVMRYTHGSDSASGVEVGILADTADASTFMPMSTCIPSSFWTWEHYIVTFPGHTSGRVALRFLGVQNVSETAHTFVDNITVEALTDSFADTCAQPTGIRVTDIHGDRATLHITSPMAVPHYMVYAGSYNLEIFSSVCTLTGLANDSLYTVGVSSICADSSLTASTMVQFRTDICAPMPLPWSENFDAVSIANHLYGEPLTDALPCWTRCGNGSSTINNVYGTTNNRLELELGSYSRNNVVVFPELQGNLASMEMSFTSTPSYPYNSTDHILQVGYTQTADDTASFHPLYSINAADYVVSYNVVPRTETVAFDSAPADARIALRIPMGDIAFEWYIDDIEVHTVQQCPVPQAVAVMHIGADTADLVISDTIAGEIYRIVLTSGDTIQTITHLGTSTLTLSGLMPATEYTVYVSALCADSTLTAAVSCTFRTMCAPLTYADMPYTLDFEDYPSGNAEEPCWRYYKVLANGTTVVEPGLIHIVENDPLLASAQSGIHALVVAAGSNTPTYWVLPAVDSLYDKVLDFGYRTAWGAHVSFNYRIDIGVMSDPLDPATFVLMDSIVTVADTYQTVHVEFYSYTGSGQYIAIRNLSSGGLTIADLTVDTILPPLFTPTGLELIAVDSVSATVAWQPGGTETRWAVELSCDDMQSVIESYTQTVTFADLRPLTNYTVRVAAQGRTGQKSDWSLPLEFTTLDTTHTIGIQTAETGGVAVFPNPAHGSVTIEATSPSTIILINLNGSTVNCWTMTPGTMTIDLTNVPRGVYFVRIVSDNNMTVSKLIVE